MIKLNTTSLVAVHLASVQVGGKVLGDVATGGGGDITPLPPTIPDEPTPTPTYTLSASVSNGVVSATLNGSAISLPYEANEGDVIVVEVVPNDGYTFEGWADGNTDNPRTITMASDVVLSAECIAVPSESKYIVFEDAEAERVLMSKGVSSDGVGITKEDAENVTSISTWFSGNKTITSFEEFRYFNGITSTNTNAFLDSTIAFIAFPNSLTIIGNATFARCSNLAIDVNVPQVTTIDKGAFLNTAIKSVYAPNLVNLYGANNLGAFAGCKSLEIANVGKVTSIPMQCFMYCSQLTEVVADWDNVTSIEGNAFLQCASLPNFEVGSKVTSIGAGAFNGCTSMQTFICRATTPPTLANANAFGNNPCIIYVPDASLEAYKTATNWNTYADRIKPLSEIEGVVSEDGYELLQDGTIKQSDNYFVVGFVSVNGGESITWGMPSGSGTVGYLVEYNAEGGRVDYWRGNANSRTITTKSSTKKIKACFLLSQKDSAYILDNTNGKYLWKGANVE